MGIGKRLKEAREKSGLTQEELARKIGVTGSAITNYEKETSHPKEPVMYALMEALGVEPNFLFQDCVSTLNKETSMRLYSQDAMKLAQDYDCLDKWGRKQVRDVADNEIARCKADRQARVAELLKESREEVDLAEEMPTLVSKSGLEAEKKKLMEALDKFSPVQLQMYFDQMRKLSGSQIEASPSFVPPEDAQKVLGPDSSAPPL